jgi:micrococcal nuclease
MYTYKAHISSVYDGDTVTAIIDCGFNISKMEKLRLFGINAPEMRGEKKAEGKKSRDFLRSLILGKEVTIKTRKDKKGKYGRYIATIFVEGDDSLVMLNVNESMVSMGHAVFKDY